MLRDRWNETQSLLALREATEASARVRPAVARRGGLSHSELVALEHLVREPHGPAELARILGVTTAASTGIVDRLVSRGHATRVAHHDDRRRTDVHVTSSGRAEVAEFLRPMFEALQANDDAFSERDRRVVARYLRGATAAFETVGGPSPQSDEVEAT